MAESYLSAGAKFLMPKSFCSRCFIERKSRRLTANQSKTLGAKCRDIIASIKTNCLHFNEAQRSAMSLGKTHMNCSNTTQRKSHNNKFANEELNCLPVTLLHYNKSTPLSIMTTQDEYEYSTIQEDQPAQDRISGEAHNCTEYMKQVDSFLLSIDKSKCTP